MSKSVLYVVINGELNMSAGKAAAQTAHAVASLHKHFGIGEFANKAKRTVIVLEAINQQQMDNLEDYLYQVGIPSASYIDEGYNEVAPYSVTALAIGPVAEGDRELFGMFPLYGRRKLLPVSEYKKTKWWHR